MLLDLGADPNRQDRKGRTPAHCGCAKGQFETVCFSIESIVKYVFMCIKDEDGIGRASERVIPNE